MLKMEITEQDFIDLMRGEGADADRFTHDGLTLLYEHYYYSQDDRFKDRRTLKLEKVRRILGRKPVAITKDLILSNWDEYENRQEAEKVHIKLLDKYSLECFTTVLTDRFTGVVVVQRL
jgi:hypothetical protein